MSEALSYVHPSLRELAVPLDTLTLDPKNARRHSRRNLDTIKASLQRHGARQLAVAQRKDGALVVRAGNGRVTAARELGWTHFPVIVIEEGDDEAAAFAIADNRSAELADWDYTMLASLTSDLEASVDLTETGFTLEEQQTLLGTVRLDGDPSVRPSITESDVIDPNSIGAYDQATDYYLIKVDSVPAHVVEAAIEAIDDVLVQFGDAHAMKAEAVPSE